jgi:hypothetical protein
MIKKGGTTMAKEDCMYRVRWKTRYDEGAEIFFSEFQVNSFISKRRKILVSYSVEKVYSNGKA